MPNFDLLLKQVSILNNHHKKNLSSHVALEQFEQTRGIKLPDSYRSFAKGFGAGELGGFFRFPTPLTQECEFDLATFDRNTHGAPEDCLWDEYGSREEIASIVFFCITGGSEWFGWMTNEVTNSETNDYAIHLFGRGPWHKLVCESFDEFIENCLNGSLPHCELDIESVFHRY